jgi:Protein of unknown function (DUF998)
MKTPVTDSDGTAGPGETRHVTARRVLLVCGILSSLLYFAIIIIIGPVRWAGYSLRTYSVSELFAFGAPSRPLLVPLGVAYQVLVTAFGFGVLLSAGRNRALRVAGGLLIAYGLVGFLGPLFSMHVRTYLKVAGPALTDNMHKILTGVTVLVMLLTIGFAAAALGKRFRLYSIATIVATLAFGGLSLPAASRIEKGLPTPWVGLTERISICVFLLWVVVLAIALMLAPSDSPPISAD